MDLKIEDLKGNARNPRRISGEALAGLKVSLARYGDIAGITYNLRDGTLVTGHQRMAALRAIYGDGLKIEGERLVAPTGESWAVRVVDWDEATANAAMVSANNEHIQGEYTDELQGLLREIEDADPEMFASLEMDKLLEDLREVDERDADDGPEDEEILTVTEPGDLWELGEHRLLCGNSRVVDDVRRLMRGERAALYATDPPYLVDYDGENHFNGSKNWSGTYGVTWDASDQGPELYEDVFRAAIGEAVKENAAWYCWHASRRQALLEDVWTKLGLLVHQQIIWTKDRPVLGRGRYLWGHEPCFFGWRRGNEPPVVTKERHSTVWYVEGVRTSLTKLHPTSKPAELFALPMRQHTLPGELCYESFGGSGSQLIAAEMTGRRCNTMEISTRYCDVIVARWCKYAGRRRVVRNGVEVDFSRLEAKHVVEKENPEKGEARGKKKKHVQGTNDENQTITEK